MTIDSALLAGRRVLVVEDEVLVSMLIEDVLAELGCEAVSTATRVPQALDLVSREAFDIAILDRNLAGQAVYPVADELARRGVPFIFATGYGDRGLREDYKERPMLQKPFRLDELARAIAELARTGKIPEQGSPGNFPSP